ncbi:hypothetical protein CFOL_v3_26071 [Cephalotus follicularis]|uniref:UDPGT domain-containing protein n=1 Tax=Cephalotus follicularis TaxID=3775 RepID=A0A1Q3CQU9_CEPFO|nr:hypothetical protein CFOL_v3_26071 [Cephalotus follicularis]
MADEPKKFHIAMFPWLAFGHIIPYMELSKLIAKKGHQISFLSTPRNVKRLPKIHPNISPSINLVSLSLPHEDKLPPNAEANSAVPYLKKAFDGLQEAVALFLETSTPYWIIHDFTPYWLAPIAAKHSIPRVFFSIYGAWTLSVIGPSSSSIPMDMIDRVYSSIETEQLTVPPKWVHFPTNVAFRLHEAKKMVNDSGFRIMTAVVDEVLAVRTCMEIVPDCLLLLGELHQKPVVVPVGLLPPELREDDNDEDAWQ